MLRTVAKATARLTGRGIRQWPMSRQLGTAPAAATQVPTMANIDRIMFYDWLAQSTYQVPVPDKPDSTLAVCLPPVVGWRSLIDLCRWLVGCLSVVCL